MTNINKLFMFNSSRFRLRQEMANFAKDVPKGALILDAGAGDSPYKDLFKHAHYESADFQKINKPYAPSTYVCDLKKIPVENCRFDYIIFNQVMEHLPEPQLVLAELYRVLKVGGRIMYTGPLFFEEHEQPYDYYRYTQFGLRYLFNKTGFIIEQLYWLEGYFGTVGYQLNCMVSYLPSRPRHFNKRFIGYCLSPIIAILKIVFRSCSLFFNLLEVHIKYDLQGYPKNYVLLASKPR